METEVAKKLFTVDEYYRMGQAGIFHPEARLELIEGEIIEMSPVGDRHIGCVNRATALFSTRLAGKVVVSVQNAVRLSRYTEPQPDIVLARPRKDYYSTRRILPRDTFLVIEISDSTIRYDRNRKMPLYAKSRVPELWIENLQENVILVYRNPAPETFATSLVFTRGQSISMAAFPEIVFKVDELLG
jgi:Uma2 family endonuclease